ncbi:MAG: hypothetical protein AAFR71_15030 [Pseudomonadota bacterium]
MELVILAIGVVVGVVLVVGLVHMTGGSKSKRFASTDQALAVFQNRFPDKIVETVHVAIGGRDALVLIANKDAIAHLHMMGANPVVRLLTDAEIARTKTMINEGAVVLPGDGLAVSATVLQFEDRTILSDVNRRMMRKTMAEPQ